MIVFKGYMLMARKKIGIILMYFIIFNGIYIAMQHFNSTSNLDNFSNEKISMAIVDCDGGEMSEQVIKYLKERHNVTMMEYDKSRMQEGLYYGEEEVVVRIPDNFSEKVLDGDAQLEITQQAGSYSYIYLENQLNDLLNSVRLYKKAGYSLKEAFDKASSDNTQVTLLDINGNGGNVPSYGYMFRFFPYLCITVLCCVLSMILVVFNRKEVKNRMTASSVSLKRQSAEMVLSFVVFGVIIWAAAIGVGIATNGGMEFFKAHNIQYYLLNSFVMMISTLALAFAIGMLVKNKNLINLIVTPVSLLISFLCGVFVPLNLMNQSVKNVGKFLPVYWYEMINDTLINFKTLSQDTLHTIWIGMGIQMMFAVAFVGIALAMAKYRQQER